jgi:hypothetical protein
MRSAREISEACIKATDERNDPPLTSHDRLIVDDQRH